MYAVEVQKNECRDLLLSSLFGLHPSTGVECSRNLDVSIEGNRDNPDEDDDSRKRNTSNACF